MRNSIYRAVVFCGLGWFCSPLLSAQEQATDEEEMTAAVTLEPITVEGKLNNSNLIGRTVGYTAPSSSVATRNKRLLETTAQSVTVLTRQQIEDQRPASLSEALNYSAGAFNGLVGAARRYDYVAVRGFNENMTDNVLIDGQRLLSDSNTYSAMQIDPYFIERIDLVKGPVSSSYGRATPGGVVAATTKRPLHERYHEINLFAGNRKQRGFSFDLTDNLDNSGNLSYRLTGLLKHSDSQNDDHESQRYVVAPSLSWNITPSTNLLLQAYLQNDPEGGYHGGLPADAMITSRNGFNFPRSFSDAEPTDRFSRRQNIYSYQLNHALGKDWLFTSKFRYADVRTHSRQTWHTGWRAGSTLTLSRMSGDAYENLKSYAFDNSVTGKLHTGIIQHNIVLGSDYQRRKTDGNWAYDFTGVSPLEVRKPAYDRRAYTYNQYPQNNRYKLSQIGLYVSDNMQWSNWFADVALRYDRVDTSVTALTTGKQSSKWEGGKATWSAAVLYALDNGISPYVNYSTGFNPNTYNDKEGNLLPPTESRQWEVGVKYQPAGGDDLYTLALYDLRQENVANRVINGNYYIPSGEVHSKGLELEGKVNVTDDWFVQGALAYNTVTFQNTTNNLDGKTPYQAPKITASLWSNYRFNNGLNVNAGIRHVQGVWADHANTVKVPASTLVDVGMRYDLKKLSSRFTGWQVSVSINNLFDRKYVSSCAGLNYCYYGEGRNVMGNLSYHW